MSFCRRLSSFLFLSFLPLPPVPVCFSFCSLDRIGGIYLRSAVLLPCDEICLCSEEIFGRGPLSGTWLLGIPCLMWRGPLYFSSVSSSLVCCAGRGSFWVVSPDPMHPLVVEATVVYEEGVVVGGTGVVDDRDQRWRRRVKLSVV